MKLKDINIGDVKIKNNVFVAPLAGYSDFAFRDICYSMGASVCYTEMVSAKGLCYGSANTVDLLYTTDADKIKAVQIFGSAPEFMRRACESEELKKFQIVDINMGCPVQKVFSSNEGSALLKDINLASNIINVCSKTGKNVTVKIRKGIKKGDNVAVEFAKMAEDSGAKAITVHGRTREDFYQGEVDFDAIEKVKNAVKIPVIANGGIFTVQDAENMFSRTGCDGIMLARGAIYDPRLIERILYGTSTTDMYSLICRHIDLLKTKYDDRYVAVTMRKQLSAYLKGVRGGKEARMKIFSSTDTQTIKQILKDVQF